MPRRVLTCASCGKRIVDPPADPSERPVAICCKGTLAAATTREGDLLATARLRSGSR